MTDAPMPGLPDFISRRRGHFRLESGYHAATWLELDTLFVDAGTLREPVAKLADALSPHAPEAICGPLTGGAFLAQRIAGSLGTAFAFTERVATRDPPGVRYPLPAPLASRLVGKRVAVVDDAVSAGSAVVKTIDTLTGCGAQVVAVGSLLTLGEIGARELDRREIPLVTLARELLPTWLPAQCPLCRSAIPLVDPLA